MKMEDATMPPLTFRRGVNIEGWLGSPDRPSEKRPLSFGPADAEVLAELGFDHIRINVNEQHLWDDSDKPVQSSFDCVDELLDACAKLGLRAIFDLHVLRCHFFNAARRPLFSEPAAVEQFHECWRRLSAHLGGRSCELLAYEYLNEPVADDPEDWNRVSAGIHTLLRGLEPRRTLILGSNRWSGPEHFAHLAIPPDENQVLTFHYYQPFFFTHHDAHEGAASCHKGPVHYPGRPIAEEDFARLTPQQRQELAQGNLPEDRATLVARFAHALAAAKRTRLPLYCGEWGCYHAAPRADRLRWHADMISILAEHDIGWAVYAYTGHWPGVRTAHGLDHELLEILLPKRKHP
jgi:endoglucanase